ncbi:hypothetical protein [Ostreibacterium oceani]|uniref:IPTL-CTERM protein sorting domain-containing protein n=1 Tax=Ostreibacterium oceani TaxID=2654998 RepID=A0A6N7EVB8_9GAMM|nr:hypothetical protein [Ostreibacterium oceani]MPV85480.1 hypothetical protein [Ostreibacterium oceani]
MKNNTIKQLLSLQWAKPATLLGACLGSLLSIAQADNILVVGNSTGQATTATTGIEAALLADGHTVTRINYPAPSAGAVATALGANNYDQIYVFEYCSNCTHLDATDIAAIATFWQTKQALVVDTRAYTFYSLGPAATDPLMNASETALVQNIASAMSTAGGGVYLGTDHATQWTGMTNAVLGAMGVDPVTGATSNPVNFADPSSVLLQNVTPDDLSLGSIGEAPLGPQPNGIEMFIHFGHDDGAGNITPYISASFPLSGPVAAISHVPVSSPWTLALALALLGWLGLSASQRLNTRKLNG